MKKIRFILEHDRFLKYLLNRDLFLWCYIISGILWSFPITGILFDPLCKICFIWGIFLILYDILGKRVFLKATYWYWLIAMLAMYCITILINVQNTLYMGCKHLAYSSIVFLIIYAQCGHYKEDNEKIVEKLKKINSTVIISIFLASFISLLMYCFHIGLRIEHNGEYIRQGFLENRLFGIYSSPNTGALFSIICIAAICINSYLNYGSLIKWKKSYIVNGIVQLVYFSLTLSNGGFLTASAFILFLIFIFVFLKLRNYKRLLLTILYSFLVAIISIIGLNIAVLGIRSGMARVPGLFVSLEEEVIHDSESEKDLSEVEFERIESGDDLSNGRLAIWSGSLKIWVQSPIFGIADARVNKEHTEEFSYSLENLNGFEYERITSIDGNLHNAYIQILTDSGLAGLLCFLIFIILIVKKNLKYLFVADVKSQTYTIVGMLVCILGAIGVNGMVENHLLFNCQDPYGLIFWFYLGCTSIFINIAVRDPQFKTYACSHQKEKFLFFCATPFQVLNCINFVESNQMDAKGKADLVIVHQFKNSEKTAEEVKKQGIFDHVYEIDPIKKGSGFKGKINTLLRVLFPRKVIRDCMRSKHDSVAFCYRFFFLGSYTCEALCFRLANPYADVYLIEDGLGTYIGNIETDFTSRLYNFMNQYFLESKLSLRTQAIYINNPEICHSKIDAEFRKINNPVSNENVMKKLVQIFGYSLNNCSSNSHFIYFTQPLDDIVGYMEAEEKRIKNIFIHELTHDTVEVRVHPRQNNYDTDGIRVSDNSQMWELECIFKIKDSQVLISAFSTTLFMPKILNNTEPTLIFVYKLLFKDTDNEVWKEKEKFIKDFAESYSDSCKVYIPSDFEEFKEILKNYANR